MRCDVESTVLPMVSMRLFHSRAKCSRFLRKRGIPFEPAQFADAQTWAFPHGGKAHAVILYEAELDTPYEDDIAILTHEAVHVAWYTFDSIGESEPAEEESCYMVQAIVRELVRAHFRWKERRLEAERKPCMEGPRCDTMDDAATHK